MLYLCAMNPINVRIMEATTTKRRRNLHPISHYWNMVKDLDDSQKLELIAMLAENIKSATTKTGVEGEEDYPLHRYTLKEMNALLDEAEANFAAGKGIPDEEAWDDLDEELACQEREEMAMAATV